jgi:hypothetical protein
MTMETAALIPAKIQLILDLPVDLMGTFAKTQRVNLSRPMLMMMIMHGMEVKRMVMTIGIRTNQ